MVNGCQTRNPKSESRTAGSARVISFLMNHRWRSRQAAHFRLFPQGGQSWETTSNPHFTMTDTSSGK
jgi:hypothetical protein